jgi:hypothetical protein
MSILKFKRGASFTFAGPVEVNGSVQDMTGWLVRCHLRVYTSNLPAPGSIGASIATLATTWLDPTQGVLQIGNSSDTSTWPLGLAVLDMELTSPAGAKTITESQIILIEERATQ